MSTSVPIAIDGVAAQPWRNGGGVTRELAAWPAGADWAWRLSVADIERTGPFSAFAGVDRVFAVLGGAGVRLAWDGREAVVTTGSPALAFDGGDPPAAEPLAGTTRDLNLMLRRDRAAGGLRRARADALWCCDARWRGVLAVAPATLERGAQAPLVLPAWSLWLSEDAGSEDWRLQAAGDLVAWWIEIRLR